MYRSLRSLVVEIRKDLFLHLAMYVSRPNYFLMDARSSPFLL